MEQKSIMLTLQTRLVSKPLPREGWGWGCHESIYFRCSMTEPATPGGEQYHLDVR